MKRLSVPRQLYARLALALAGLFLLIAAAYAALAIWSTQRHYQEVTQRINSSLAMYIAGREPLLTSDGVNHQAMDELAKLVMTVNPSVEVYLLDTSGRILDHALPEDSVVKAHVDPRPIRSMVAGKARLPVTAADPRNAGAQRIFSAAPVTSNGATVGYLYVVLAGLEYQTLADSLQGSYIIRLSLGAAAVIVLFGLGSGLLIFRAMTRPLQRLAADMERFQSEELGVAPQGNTHAASEIVVLEHGFQAMRERIHDQFERLQENDRVRRELVSNVSHDLRTPLASMQGYLETLMIKADELPAEQREQYVQIAHRHCARLTQLVNELFELTKLDAGRMQPKWERFSLAELVQDVSQKFALEARKQDIDIRIEAGDGLYPVRADIALIERVLENLIDNALRHTPAGGQVTLSLAEHHEQVDVQVADTGQGVTSEELPHIFDRYFRGTRAERSGEHTGSGLGLAIVQRILELHGSRVEVISASQSGTTFRFPLTRAA